MKNSYFSFRQFTIHQERCAMKVGTDGTLLGAWAAMPSQSAEQPRILDVGTGTGLIALMMAQRFPEVQVVGIDIDAEAVSQAQENVAASPFARRVSIVQQDFSMLLPQYPCRDDASHGLDAPSPSVGFTISPFSLIVCNPPFFSQSLPCPDGRRTMARHEGTLTYRSLSTVAWRVLSDNGELCVIVPADQQSRMESEATMAGFSLHRECKVCTSPGKPPKRVLLAFAKHPVTPQRTVLTIGSPEYHELMRPYFL